MWPIAQWHFDDNSWLSYAYSNGEQAWFIMQLRRGESEAKSCLEFFEEVISGPSGPEPKRPPR